MKKNFLKNIISLSLIIYVLLLAYTIIIPCVYAGNDTSDNQSYLSSALANERNAAENLNDLKLPSIFEIAFRFLLAMIIIFIIIAIVAFFYKQYFNSPLARNESKIIKILEHRYIDPKKSLFLIEVAGKYFLLSSSADNLSLISEIKGNNTEEYIEKVLEFKSDIYKDKDFNKMLLGMANNEPKSNNSQTVGSKVKPGINFIKDKIQQIKKIINES